MDNFLADERSTYEGMLDAQREEIAALLAGVEEAEARARLVPSLTTVLGVVKHATFVERVWFHSRVAGVPRAELGIPESVEESFILEPEDTVASVLADYLAACEESRAVAATRSLDAKFPWHHGPVSLRHIYARLVAELARHAGHGDILLEQLHAARPASP